MPPSAAAGGVRANACGGPDFDFVTLGAERIARIRLPAKARDPAPEIETPLAPLNPSLAGRGRREGFIPYPTPLL